MYFSCSNGNGVYTFSVHRSRYYVRKILSQKVKTTVKIWNVSEFLRTMSISEQKRKILNFFWVVGQCLSCRIYELVCSGERQQEDHFLF